MPKPNAIRMTTVNLSQITKDDPETLEKLWKLYTNLTGYRRESVRLTRLAATASAEAAIADAQVTKSLGEFLSLAGEVSETVAVEPMWLPPFTNSDREIVIESPMTQRDQRIAVRRAHQQMTTGQADNDDLGLSFDDDNSDN